MNTPLMEKRAVLFQTDKGHAPVTAWTRDLVNFGINERKIQADEILGQLPDSRDNGDRYDTGWNNCLGVLRTIIETTVQALVHWNHKPGCPTQYQWSDRHKQFIRPMYPTPNSPSKVLDPECRVCPGCGVPVPEKPREIV